MRRRAFQLALWVSCGLIVAACTTEPAPRDSTRVSAPAVVRVDYTRRVEAWMAVLPDPTTTTTTTTTSAPRIEGTQGAQRRQAETSWDSDRFDRLAQCESGGDPTTNTGNGFYGAFQFMLSSWHRAGGTGYPHEHSYAEQKQTAMYWASITNPATQWPVCWPRSA